MLECEIGFQRSNIHEESNFSAPTQKKFLISGYVRNGGRFTSKQNFRGNYERSYGLQHPRSCFGGFRGVGYYGFF